MTVIEFLNNHYESLFVLALCLCVAIASIGKD